MSEGKITPVSEAGTLLPLEVGAVGDVLRGLLVNALKPSPRLQQQLEHVHRHCAALERQPFQPLRRLALRYARRRLGPLNGTMLCPTRAGLWVCLSADTGAFIYRDGTYEEGTLDVIRRLLRPDDAFVDAGASVGIMSLTAGAAVGPGGRVLAFEPTARRFSHLLLGIYANGMSQVRAFHMGLGSEAREILIHHDRPSPSMLGEGSPEKAERTRIEPLDAVLQREQVPRVRMLKIDVEGFETEVLRGAQKLLAAPEPPAVCLEHGVYAPNGQSPLALLRAANPSYRFFQLALTKRTPSPLLPVDEATARPHDNVFCLAPEHTQALGLA